MQYEIDFHKPLLSGKGWRTLTTVGRAQSKQLEMMLRSHNNNRELFGLSPVGVAEMIRVRYSMTTWEWCHKVFNVRDYWVSLSKYKNNKSVL